MTPNAIREVLEELRDLLEDETVELVASYEVWVLPEQALSLKRDARFVRGFHHQVRTAHGLSYVRSSMRGPDELELDEIGNNPTAVRIEEAAVLLGRGELRLLLFPSRQIIALWDPTQAKLAAALSGVEIFASSAPLSEESFESLLGEMAASAKPSSGASTETSIANVNQEREPELAGSWGKVFLSHAQSKFRESDFAAAKEAAMRAQSWAGREDLGLLKEAQCYGAAASLGLGEDVRSAIRQIAADFSEEEAVRIEQRARELFDKVRFWRDRGSVRYQQDRFTTRFAMRGAAARAA